MTRVTADLRRLLAAWAFTRVLMVLMLLIGPERAVFGDISTFHKWSDDAWYHGVLPGRDFAWEYPPGALLCLMIPVGGTGAAGYFVAFLGLALVVDVAFLLLLHELGRRRGSAAGTWLWLWAVAALGPLALTRYDVVPSALAAVGAVLAAAFPRSAAALVVLGASIKVWPLVVLIPMVVLSGRARRLALGTAISAVALLTTAAVAGVLPALRSTLDNQLARGSQVESLAALPYLWARRLGVHVEIAYRHSAWEASATGSDTVSLVLSIGSAVGITALAWAGWRRRRQGRAPDLLVASAGVVALLLIGDKVFSPQYVLWLLALVAVAACRPGAVRLRVLRTGVALALVSQLVYPLLYDQLLAGDLLPLLLLTARDALLALMAVDLIRTQLAGSSS